MPACFVKDCHNTDRKKKQGVTFHRFPKQFKVEWLSAIGREPDTLIIQERVCSDHFRPEDFEQFGALRKLKANVIPTINLPRTTTRDAGPDRKIISATTGETSMEPPTPSTSKTVHDLKSSCPQNFPLGKLPSSSSIGLISSSSETEEELKIQRDAPSTSEPKEDVKKGLKRKIVTDSSSSSPEKKTKSLSDISSASSGTKRRVVKALHTYSLSPEHYLKQIQEERHKGTYYKTKYVNIKKTTIRRKKKIISLKTVMLDIKKKFALSSDALTVLENSFAGIPFNLMKRMLANNRSKGNLSRREYSKELKTFAMTLQFYSSKAYDYVRKTFDLALPAPSTIRAWLSKIDCSPGYSQPSLDSLKIRASEYFQKYNRQLLCSLILDEMAIKKEIVNEKSSQNIWGYIDVGTDLQLSNDTEPATEALVLMVVAVNDNFKLPVAYFFINKISGEEKANIVREALCQLYQTGIKILSVTCDGPHVHFRMMRELGCNIDDPQNFKTHFAHPVDGTKVHVIFDICHMLKLVRNNWANSGVFLDPYGHEIKWHYIIKLYELQQKEGLFLGNKLRKKHIEWKKAIMKVNLAAQTLSTSVADALEFLCKDLELEEFKGVEATVRFIRVFDQLFDILNSRNPWGRGMKTPLRSENENYWRPVVGTAMSYILQCKDEKGTLLYTTLKKVPFLGFAVSLTSLLDIYDEQVKINRSLTYILTYKFSQDHLELFFCSIRSRNGWNVNPNCLEFMRTYKRLLFHQDIRDNTGNCIAQDQTNILTVSSTKQELNMSAINIMRNSEDNKEVSAIEKKIELFLPINLSEFSENVIAYISGFVIRMVEKRIKCSTCLEVLRYSEDIDHADRTLKLINRKSRGGLLLPSLSLREICTKVEKKLQIILKVEGQIPHKQILIKCLLKETMNLIFNDNIFKSLNEHLFDQEIQETSHKKILIQEIIKCYSSIRIHSITKQSNEQISGAKIRKTLNKLILFKHQ